MKPRYKNQIGAVNILLVPLVLVILLLVAAAGFGYWAFSGRQDYKNHADQKVAVAVKSARQDEAIAKDKAYAEVDKQPLKPYKGPEQYGSLIVNYPKTWSGYVVSDNSSTPIDGYFKDGVVPGISDGGAVYALRVQVLDKSYSSVVTSLNSQVTNKTLTATPFAFAKVPKIIGIRYDGTVNQSKKLTGSMVVVPLRDKTVQIWTESPTYANDFNNLVLPNVTFSP